MKIIAPNRLVMGIILACQLILAVVYAIETNWEGLAGVSVTAWLAWWLLDIAYTMHRAGVRTIELPGKELWKR